MNEFIKFSRKVEIYSAEQTLTVDSNDEPLVEKVSVALNLVDGAVKHQGVDVSVL